MTQDELQEVTEINHYTGGDRCHYHCGDLAEFVVQGKTGRSKVTFAACRSCLNRAYIYPIDNEWVDERTDQIETS